MNIKQLTTQLIIITIIVIRVSERKWSAQGSRDRGSGVGDSSRITVLEELAFQLSPERSE